MTFRIMKNQGEAGGVLRWIRPLKQWRRHIFFRGARELHRYFRPVRVRGSCKHEWWPRKSCRWRSRLLRSCRRDNGCQKKPKSQKWPNCYRSHTDVLPFRFQDTFKLDFRKSCAQTSITIRRELQQRPAGLNPCASPASRPGPGVQGKTKARTACMKLVHHGASSQKDQAPPGYLWQHWDAHLPWVAWATPVVLESL